MFGGFSYYRRWGQRLGVKDSGVGWKAVCEDVRPPVP